MGDKMKHRQDVQELLDSWLVTGDANPLTQYLTGNSNLPGPRGNLELAWAFGDMVGERSGEASQPLWDLCFDLVSITEEQAPVNDPKEFLPFCGVMGLAAVAVETQEIDRTVAIFRNLSKDPRWRMREGVCMGLQRLMEDHPEAVIRQLASWADGGDPLEMRAAAAAVADPGLLKKEIVKDAGLKIHRTIFSRLLEFKDRKSEPFKVLRQGLGFTLSVVVQASPEEGFVFMGELAGLKDKDVEWILKENLKKNRLVKYYPHQVESILQLFG